MAGEPDQVTALLAAQGGLRASDADRDRVVGVLQDALARGQLSRDEFTARMGRALRSRTWADLAAVTAGLGGITQPRHGAGGAVTRRVLARKAAARAAGVMVLAAVVAAFFTYYGGFIVLFMLAFAAFVLSAAPPGTGVRRRR